MHPEPHHAPPYQHGVGMRVHVESQVKVVGLGLRIFISTDVWASQDKDTLGTSWLDGDDWKIMPLRDFRRPLKVSWIVSGDGEGESSFLFAFAKWEGWGAHIQSNRLRRCTPSAVKKCVGGRRPRPLKAQALQSRLQGA